MTVDLYRGWPAARLMALQRVYKKSGFFRDPRDVKELRWHSVDAQIREFNYGTRK